MGLGKYFFGIRRAFTGPHVYTGKVVMPSKDQTVAVYTAVQFDCFCISLNRAIASYTVTKNEVVNAKDQHTVTPLSGLIVPGLTGGLRIYTKL